MNEILGSVWCFGFFGCFKNTKDVFSLLERMLCLFWGVKEILRNCLPKPTEPNQTKPTVNCEGIKGWAGF